MPSMLIEKFDVSVLKKLENFSLARLILLTAVLFTTIFLRQEVLGRDTIVQLYSVLAVSFFLTLMHVTFWEDTLKVRYFIPSQLLYDLLLTSYFVYLTGINDSIFLFLYLLNIVFSSIIFQLNGALLVALASGIVYGLIYYVNNDFNSSSSIYNLAYDELLFLLTALLCGQLMDELKRQKNLLASQKADIDRLTDLNTQLLNSIPVGVVTVGHAGRVENINQTALTLLKLKEAPREGDHYQEILPSLVGIPEQWDNLPPSKKIRYTFSHQLPNKSSAKFSLQVVPFPDDKASFILVFQDISKNLQIEQQRELDSRLAATGQLAAGIAHEIRNPLASISGSIETLNSHLQLESEEDKKLIAISLREIKRLNKLITDFLEFAKPRDEKIQKINVREKLQEVIDALQNRKSESVAAKFSIEVPESIEVQADPERLKQIFFNLLMNSMESIGSGVVEVSIQAEETPNGIKIHIKDNGPGVPQDLKSKIFDPFFTTKSTGTGLGLSTVAQIMNGMFGKISLIESNQGAHFELSFPNPLERAQNAFY